MKAETQQAIQFLRAKISAIDAQANDLKKIVNDFSVEAGEPAPYALTTADSATTLGSLRSDYFYGHTLAEAAEEYLKMRKTASLGSASINDIYKALKEGGYKFDTKTEEYAKNGVRISLRKTPAIFHQLPNGDYGLCVWYGIKGRNEDPTPSRKKHGKHQKHKSEPKQSVEKAQSDSKSAKSEAGQSVQNGNASQNSNVTGQQLEAAVSTKSGRITDLAKRLHTTDATVQKLLEPASRVYKADAGWLKIRE